MLPTISVVMPNFNHAKWLPRSISALLRQRRVPDEIIVIDDGSSDDSASVLTDFARETPRLHVIRHASNAGIVSRLNEGLSLAHGEFVYFAAADDCVLPGLCEAATGALRDNPEAAFYCGNVVRIDQSADLAGFRPFTPPALTPGYISPAEVRTLIRSSDNWFVGHSVVFRTQKLRDIGGFDERLGSLCDSLAARLLAFEDGFVFDPEVHACWMVYPESLSARSALSGTERDRLIRAGCDWIESRFPEDVRAEYKRLFEERYRFNLARLLLLWGGRDADPAAICETLRVDPSFKPMIAALLRFGRTGTLAIMAGATLKLRPFKTSAILRGMRNQRHLASRSREIQDMIAQIPIASQLRIPIGP